MILLSRLTLFIGLFLCITARGYTNVMLYDESRGLSNHIVSQLLKDRTGLLWIATESGLNTFDGYNFKEIEDFRGLKVRSLCYDSLRHVLWVGCNTGLYRLDVATQRVLDCTLKSRHKEVIRIFLYNDAIYPVFVSGTILKITSDGSAEPVFNLAQAGEGNHSFRKQMATDYAGRLYLMPDGSGSLVCLDLGTKKFRIIKDALSRDIWEMTSAQGYIIAQWNRQGIQIYNETGVAPGIEEQSQKEERIGLLYGYKGEYYASLRGYYGVYQLNSKTMKWELLKSNDNVTFKSKMITAIFRDAHDVLWIGTNKGLIKMNLEKSFPFKTIFEGYSPAVSNRQIIKGHNNDLYIATYNGIYNYNLNTRKAVLLDSSETDSVFPLYTRALLLRGKYIYAGTESHTNFFYRYNLMKNCSEGGFYKIKPANAQISSVHSMFEDSRGVIWLATDKGLASYDTTDETLTLHSSGKYSVGATRLFYICASGKTKFWAAGRNGAYLLDIEKGVEKRLLAGLVPKMPTDDYIFAGEDINGKLWLGTKKSGIVVPDSGYRNAKVINTSNGLSANEVYAILWQDQNTAWISTVNGLCRYTISAGSFSNYFYEDGVSDNEFNQNSFLRYNDQLFLIGGINGITYFNPWQIKLDPDPLTIFNASASKWNQGLQSFVFVNANSHVIMRPDDHLLEFTFGLSDFRDAEAHSYFYRINGLYNDWVSLGNQNILRLEGLPAGSYIVEVIGFNKRGVASANSLQYTIRIVQVFYKTWWFYVLLAIGISALVFGYFRWRIHNLQQKQKLRTQIASNLHDEVGSLLTSIIISTDSARYSSQSVEEKNIKLEKISALSRDATNTMSDVLWSIDARNDYAGNLTDRMREQAEAMLLPLSIDVEFDFTATQQEQNIHPDTRQQLYLIFKEAINNIAKHSKASWVKVYYKQQGKSFELVVRNDSNRQAGETASYPGQGLKNMEMRARRINAVCSFGKAESSFSVVVKSK
jgi:ligand-binding sensor domain-containing protein/signal transduction histidine kinase